ncbi:MAG: hypothetical protein AAFQ87_20605 [Bacteroidota bacterium]
MKLIAPSCLILLLFMACEPEPVEPPCDGSLQISIVSQTDSDCEQAVGTVEVRAIGGDGQYRFSLDGGSAQESNQFSGIASGEHQVTVTDGQACSEKVSFSLKSGVSFDQVQPIIASNCAVSGCHDGSNNQIDLRPAANIKSRANSIKSLTEDGSMPPDTAGTSLSETQIRLIGCWVDDGAE